MNAILSLFVCWLMICLLNCVGADDPPRSLPVRSLARGAFSGIKEAKHEIIRDTDGWEKFWKQHSVPGSSAAKIPAVNFSKEMAIAVTMGVKRTGGYTIEIVRVEMAGKTLRIFVKQTSPPPGALTIQALTAPFHFVAVPRSDLKAEFVEDKPAVKQ